MCTAVFWHVELGPRAHLANLFVRDLLELKLRDHLVQAPHFICEEIKTLRKD